ncbi:hypothetical protein ACIBJF_38130 [Streptomyces sp. NPDC050743]|uniref:hypothetical protein n=1 Tax=Streptomyces sp. NPDC050743 TaxID=3365634 RepID=UPI0037A6861D
MTSRLDVLLAALDRQGFKSRQTRQGAWFFSRNGTTIMVGREPETPGKWIVLISELRGAGFVFPEED